MSNLAYCRFENTYADLSDCYRAMKSGTDGLSESEKKYFEKMVDMCKEIAEKYHTSLADNYIRSSCCNAELIEFKGYGYNECSDCGKTYRRQADEKRGQTC